MKVEQVVCDECKRVRGESNHWYQIGVLKLEQSQAQLTIGIVPDKQMPAYEVHDVCGAQCFHRHIDRLLGIPVPADEPPPLPRIEQTVAQIHYPDEP